MGKGVVSAREPSNPNSLVPARVVRDSLDRLSVGDALGAQFFVPGRSVPDLLAAPGEWR